MTDIERRRFESLENLRCAAYDSFNDRRSYEWKFSLSIWAMLAVILAGVLQPAKMEEFFPLQGSMAKTLSISIAVLLVILHACWSYGAAQANSIDKVMAQSITRVMEQMLDISFDEAVNRKMKVIADWKNWSHVVQVLITALLAIAIILVMFARLK